MKKFPASVLLLAPCLTAPQVIAAPVYITAPTTVTFNFDFAAAGASLPPPWIEIAFGIQRDSVWDDGETDSGWIKIFGDLDGAGDRIDKWGWLGWDDGEYSLSIQGSGPDLVDGIFSVVYGATAGTMALDTPVGSLYDASWNVLGRLEGVLAGQGPTQKVPEPPSGPLAGLAVAAMAFLVRRNRNAA